MVVCVPLKNALVTACLLLAVTVHADAQEPTVTTSTAERQVVCEVRLHEPVSDTSKDSDQPVNKYATAEEARMSERLHRRVTCRFENVDLVSIFNQIHRETGVVIAFDRASVTEEDLEKTGLSAAELEDIDLEFKEVELHAVLTAILESVGFGYYVEDGIVKVTTKAKADDYFYVCVHDCSELSEQGTAAVMHAMIIIGEVKLNTVDPETSIALTGEKGFSCSYPTTGCVVVRANRKTHRQVENILSKIHKFERSKALRKAEKENNQQRNTTDNTAADLSINSISYIDEPSNFSELNWQLPSLKEDIKQHKKELTHFMSGGIYYTR